MHKPCSYTLLAASLLFSLNLSAQPAGDLPLMPWPQQVELAQPQGKLVLDYRLTIGLQGDDLAEAIPRWRERIERQTGWTLAPQGAKTGPATISIVIKRKVAPQPMPDSDESYQLKVTPQGATLTANTRFGALHGMETLLQLVQTDGENTFIPLVNISDVPRFPWRGVLLDSARHFLPVADILRQLDGMAAAKLNVFHWHLTDDQGWRFASQHYPKLQQLASDGYFYTREQMQQVVAYATARGIRVVPEIDLPGHASTIAVAYPELMSAPGPYQMERAWGVHKPTLDPANSKVYQFVDSIIGELVAIFPDPYLHIGGDEVDATQWQESKSIQAFMQQNQLADAHALQAFFNQKLEKILEKHHRRMVGWDEIYHPALPHNIVIQSWQGPDSLAASAQDGYQGILSTGFYLDQPQSTAYHYRNEIMPQPLGVATAVQEGEQAQSWQFSMPRFKGSAVEGTFTLIEGKTGWRGFIDFKGKSRRAVQDIQWRTPEQVTFRIDSWMGETHPVLTLQQDQLSGYTLVGNVRYPTTGSKLAAIPAGKAPVVPDEQHQAQILGGEAAFWAENIRAPILDIKMWPRTFAVAERLWSAQDVTDESNMYQRLAAVDAWSVVSVGLQQQAETAREFTRLANSVDITPLQILAEAVEPAQYYTRNHLKFKAGNYHQFEPLNRFADALPAESMAVRDLHAQVTLLLQDKNHQAAAQAIRERLQHWQRNAVPVQRVIAGNVVMKDLAPVGQDVSALADLGLMLLERYQQGKPLSQAEVAQAQRQLDAAAQIRDEVVIAAVYPLEALLRGVTKR
ncbi:MULTISPECIES: family 20 glycosylhydrolase [unclassified Serratia (in: enterobacteria)]|uniref:family 20 glycosylhydrolase n=1 Tax=unclassified Serratia (in: enterobacteria) TaxID=2647522 RepID=UPI0005032E8F|nr:MULTISPECIES: family 20 glycosylhydrolase [unclassified Serratia (in: enterobacteria)]KFK94066.1 beta-N-acetylhexosaminidase [Serratia sp. Ag2]KFL00597.1 beta-N-acetylhexosaminidase [Serratia sp. Ag1]